MVEDAIQWSEDTPFQSVEGLAIHCSALPVLVYQDEATGILWQCHGLMHID